MEIHSQSGASNEGEKHSEEVEVKLPITGSWHKIKQKLGLQEWVQFG